MLCSGHDLHSSTYISHFIFHQISVVDLPILNLYISIQTVSFRLDFGLYGPEMRKANFSL